MAHVWMKHKDHGGMAQLPAGVGWEDKGWEETDEPTGDDFAAIDAIGSDFDPAEHSAADVKTHLESAGTAERDRVIAAERGGKNRSSITGD